MFKKKCPVCGAKNSKERTVCIECGAPLASEQVKRQLPQVSTKCETQEKKEVKEAAKERIEDEYKDNEKVLHRARGKIKLPHKKSEEADCLVTEAQVVIETKEPIKIHFYRIKKCSILTPSPYPPGYYHQEYQSRIETLTLWFLDDLNKEYKLSLDMPLRDLQHFRGVIEKRRKQMAGKFFDNVEECPPHTALVNLFRDKTRDNLRAGLQRLGIDARMIARGRVEEEIWSGFSDGLTKMPKSLGIIHIPEGPIRWVNILKETYYIGSQTSHTDYYTEYGVPNPRLRPDSPNARIKTIRVKSVPVFGKVVDLHWEGGESYPKVVSRLNSDDKLRQPIMKSRDVTITAIGDCGCWIMSTQTRDVPSGELWNCYQAIAKHLLAEWPK